MAKLMMRSISEAVRAGADKPAHGLTVKIYTNTKTYEIAITLTSDTEFGKLDAFIKSSESVSLKRVVRPILYDNQEIFIAYWFNLNPNNQIGKTLEQILISNIIQSNYVKNPVNTPKTKEELDDAKEELQDTIRTILQDDTIVLQFNNR